MVYMGSKNRIAKYIIPIIQKYLKEKNYNVYFEPFVGGANMIDKVECEIRIGCDINKSLIELIKHFQKTVEPLWIPSKAVWYEYWEKYKNGEYKDWRIGYCGAIASFSGKYFGSYGTENDYKKYRIKCCYNNFIKQLPNIKDVIFSAQNYTDINLPEYSVVYLDPPYGQSTKYGSVKWDAVEFYKWIDNIDKTNKVILLSTVDDLPSDKFELLWSKELSHQLSKNRHEVIEKLYLCK